MVIVYNVVFMSSWKNYGGRDNFDKSNHITVNSIVADYFTVKKQFVGDFDICGNLIAHKQLIVDGSAVIYGKLVTRSVDVSGDLAVNDITCLYNGSFNNLSVNNDLNMSNNQFIHGDVSGIGINARNPRATLDISGNNISSVNVYTSKNKNRNVLAHNINHNGIALWSDSSNAGIDFFVTTDISINNTGFDGRIQYDNTGNLLLDADNYVNIIPQLVISDFSADIVYNNSIVTIHGDNSSNLFNYDSYKNRNVYVQNAITTVTMDNSSVMFMNFIKPDRTGFSIAGGNCPYDSTRIIGSVGFNDLSNHMFTANQTIISGNSTIKYKTTTGINTYKPIVDKYVLDINGPVHIRNGENNIVARSRTTVKSMKFNKTNKNNGFAIAAVDGSNIPVFYTENRGQTWNMQDLFQVQKLTNSDTVFTLNTVFVYDSSYAFAIGNNLNGFYTFNCGITWKYFYLTLNIPFSPKSLYICNTDVNRVRFFITAFSNDYANDKLIYMDASINGTNNSANNVFNGYSNIKEKSATGFNDLYNTNNTSVIDGYGNFIYVAGNMGIYKYRIDTISEETSSRHQVRWSNTVDASYAKYNAISVFDNSYVVAAGDRILSFTRDGGNSWYDFSYQYNFFHPQWYNFTSVDIFDSSNAIAVSNNGKIAYTNDGLEWNDASASTVFNLSGSEKMLDGSLNNVAIVDKNSFILTNTTNTNVDNSTNIVYNYFPELFNHVNNHVLDVSGNMNIYGNITIFPDNTDIIHISSNANTCNFLNGVTNMFVGKSDSLTTFNGDITVNGGINATAVRFSNTELAYLIIDPSKDTNNMSRDYALDISGNANVKIGKNLDVMGSASFGSNLENFTVNSISRFNNNAIFNNTVSIVYETALSITGNTRTNGSVSIYNENQSINLNNEHGAFFVSGHAKINKNLFVMQNMLIYGSANNIYSLDVRSGNVNLNENLQIMNNKLFINCDTSFNGNIIINGDSSFNGNIFVNSVNGSKLIVNSDSSFNGNISFGSSRINNDGTLTMNKDASFNGNIFVNSVNGSKLIVNGDSSFNGNISFGSSRINHDGTLTMNKDASFNGNIFVNGVNGSKLIVNGDSSFNGNISFGSSRINHDGTLTMNKDASFNSNVYFGSTYFDSLGNFYTNKSVTFINNNDTNNNPTNPNAILLNGRIAIKGVDNTNAQLDVYTPCTFLATVVFKYETTFEKPVSFADNIGNVYVNSLKNSLNNIRIISNVDVSGNLNIAGELDVSGSVMSNGVNLTSDYRIKTNVQNLDGRYTIENIRPVSYTNILSNTQSIGVIAHELQEHFPFLVNGEKDGEKYQSVNYTGLIGLLIHEVQVLKKKVEYLESKM